MNRRMTFGQYRTMDLTAFAIMLIASESVIQTASTAWFPGQPYTVSVTAAITAIVLMRWKKYAALHAVLGGLVFCFHLKAGPNQYLIYCLGNLGAMLLLPVLRKTGDERIRNDARSSCRPEGRQLRQRWVLPRQSVPAFSRQTRFHRSSPW